MLSSNVCLDVLAYFPMLLPELYHRLCEYVRTVNVNQVDCSEIVASFLNASQLVVRQSLLQNQIILCLNWISEFQNLDGVVKPFLKLVLLLMQKCHVNVEKLGNEKFIIACIDSDNIQIRWYACRIFAQYLRILDTDSFLRKHFNPKEFEELILSESCNEFDTTSVNIGKTFNDEVMDFGVMLGPSRKLFVRNDFKGKFVPMFNALFEFCGKNKVDINLDRTTDLVLTKSTISNLKSLALAVLSESSVLLTGEIGCGKTALVEFLASYLGCKNPPEMLKLQLGDQTDSKVCLFIYLFIYLFIF